MPQGKLGDIPDNLFMPSIGKSEWKLVTPTGKVQKFVLREQLKRELGLTEERTA